MKIHKIVAACLLGAFLVTTSCSDFLDQTPESKLPGDKIFADPGTTNAYILGLYHSWREGHKGRVDAYAGTDEGVVGGFQHDDYERRGIEEYGEGLNSTNGKIRGIWTNRYEVISRATPAIEELKKNVELEDEELNRYLGEACLLRAENLWELALYFGPVPVYNEEHPEYGGFRQPLDLIHKHIEEDLLIAEKYLPDPANVTDQGRVNKALAQALLGKLYLHAPEGSGYRNYQKAAEYFKKVVDNPYYQGTGAPEFADIFDSYRQNTAEHNREMIYAFRYLAGSPNNNAVEWDLGSRAVAQMTPVEAMAPWAGFDGLLPSEYCYSMVSEGGLWEEGDVRREESIRYEFEWNGHVPDMTGWVWDDELEPHVKKYEDLRIVESELNTWHSGKNIPFMRYADVVLCYAECLAKTGNVADGVTLVNNVVRKRAFGGTLPADKAWSASMSQQEFIEKIMDERMRELCFEGWRKFDLLRTGLINEYVPKRNRWFIAGAWTNRFGKERDLGSPITSIADYKLIWPIPLEELRQNPDLSDSDQNPGYAD